MNVKCCIAVLVLCFVSFSVWAECPVKETTIVFVNGIWTDDKEAKDHMELLREEIYSSDEVSEECVHVDFSHTQNDGKIIDLLEVLGLRSLETGTPFKQFVRMLKRVVPGDPDFFASLETVYENGIPIRTPQVNRHLKRIREVALDKGHQLIVVSHSEGGLYTNLVYSFLTLEEQARTYVVSVVTPSDRVAGEGSNTRLSRDFVANAVVAFSGATVAGTVINDTDPCEDEEPGFLIGSFVCHGFGTGYLHVKESRDRIITKVVELLPTAPASATITGRTLRPGPGGRIPEGGAHVEFRDNVTGELLASTTSDPRGYYSLEVPPCSDCALFAEKRDSFLDGFTDIATEAGESYEVDVIMFFSGAPMPS